MPVSYEAGFGAGGGSVRASTADSKPHRLWVPSQKGLFDDSPQRQRVITVRPARSNGRPSWSTSTKSPSMRTGPLLRIVTLADMLPPGFHRVAGPAPVRRLASQYILPEMAPQFIFTMHKVGKVHPPNREVLKDISLSFYPGAKIGVLGQNGSGKSSLLRIMAGVDPDYIGDARAAKGIRIG